MRTAFFATALLSALVPSLAYAAPSSSSETKECIAAFDEGQRLKTEHHLKDAHTRLLACSKEACPSVLRADCAEVLRNVQNALPSIVLAADDGGKDVVDVKVTHGNDVLATALDAKAIELDPGTYEVTFEHGANKPIKLQFVLREGEKNRVVKASFNPKKPDQFKLVTPPRSPAGYAVPGIFATLGVAGFIVAGISRLAFDSQVDDMTATCQPNCTQEERDNLSSKLVRANVGLGVGIGSLVVAAATWFIFSPSPKMVSPGTAALTW